MSIEASPLRDVSTSGSFYSMYMSDFLVEPYYEGAYMKKKPIVNHQNDFASYRPLAMGS